MKRLMIALAAVTIATPVLAQVSPPNQNYDTEDSVMPPSGYYTTEPDTVIVPSYGSGSRALSPGLQPTPREQNPDSTPASQSPGGAVELPGQKGMGN